MSAYDRTIVLVGRYVPPTCSWWVGCDRAAFMAEWRRQVYRMTHSRLPAGVERALQQAEASWRTPDRRIK